MSPLERRNVSSARCAASRPMRQSRVPTDADWMELALAEADRALEHADVPIGCVIVGADGVELSRDHNRREECGDPTAHAEVLALRSAAAKIGHWRLEGATVYATLEPCVMCAGALVNARVYRVVFGASDLKAGALVTLFSVGADARLNHRFEIEGGVRAEESISRLRAFFGALRSAGQK
jgi:tRNA(adenine34) deaminase